MLDDILNGLDADTYTKCFSAILGPEGLLRRSHRAVILATHNGVPSLTEKCTEGQLKLTDPQSNCSRTPSTLLSSAETGGLQRAAALKS